MSKEETKLARQILGTHFKNAYLAFRSRSGDIYPVTGSTPQGFTTPGFHFTRLEEIRLADFQIIQT